MFGIDDLLLGAIAKPIIGGLFGASGQSSANSANAAINNNNNDFNAAQSSLSRDFNSAEAQKNRDFQEQMTNTGWQRSVADMQKAGLSPMLAYSKGGASSPGGSQASSSAASASSPIAMGNVGSAAANGAASAANVANTLADTANKKATQDLISAQVGATNNSAGLSAAQTTSVNAAVEKIKSETVGINNVNLNYQKQVDVLMATAKNLSEQANLATQRGMTESEQRKFLQASASNLVSTTALRKFDIDAASSFGNAGRDFGQLKPVIDVLFDAIRLFKR